MKKKIYAVSFLSLFILASCKKDRVCTCTSDNGDKETTTFYKVKKRDARENCLSQQTVSFDNKSGTTNTSHKVTCELK